MKKKFSENVVWRLFNPMIPNIVGNYFGVDGVLKLFRTFDIIIRDPLNILP
ncbi:hypothetical protein Q4Q39_02445 [Flavivirga amylovorans]|uniref:Uncharacterized protein n=1 Tax=Flavivirga amylovorans TaxID=870486 RepID=A0ABT8WX48_9FLAO|nr:hypothetical protein [Flavivirga amylovorans]MDO5986253.1 hypothetical protein [Flavivirga amylovorans]